MIVKNDCEKNKNVKKNSNDISYCLLCEKFFTCENLKTIRSDKYGKKRF